ncbi:MAG: hypothetical protein EZS28_024367 [Streblomastix strix]|uniref:Tyr recombinase domain-containing protein n=1 Tax=Streblomastix strix TaxID=222440 RepID=A0A5J4VCC6_9EUKA|nr:MAG: hypothetical protein EZS28_024367 [Streblomastix strix]
MLRARIWKVGVLKCYGSNTIRHSVLTALRNKGVTLEDVNKLTDHAYGSRVVDDFYNKPDSPKAIQDYIGNEENINLMIGSLKDSNIEKEQPHVLKMNRQYDDAQCGRNLQAREKNVQRTTFSQPIFTSTVDPEVIKDLLFMY